MMIANLFVQACIFTTGLAGVYLSQSKSANKRKFACFFGMAGQPFWLYASINSEQYAIALMSIVYFAVWAKGFKTHWIDAEQINEY